MFGFTNYYLVQFFSGMKRRMGSLVFNLVDCPMWLLPRTKLVNYKLALFDFRGSCVQGESWKEYLIMMADKEVDWL